MSAPVFLQLIDNVERVLFGKRAAVETVVAALLARGHVLLEDVPGVGKTILARALARSIRAEFRRLATVAGVRRRFAPHQLRHAHAIELARERVPLNIIQRQLGHANLGTTSIYLQGIDTEEIIATVHGRRGPMMSASAGLRL